MLGPIVGDFLCQIWERTGEVEETEQFEGVRISPLILRVLGAAHALYECEAGGGDLQDEAAYWIHELVFEYDHDVSSADEDQDEPDESCADVGDVGAEGAPAGDAAGSRDEAEEFAGAICAEANADACANAMALAGAVWMGSQGEKTEQISEYLLGGSLQDGSPVLAGMACVLRAEDFVGAVQQALAHGLGINAAIAAASIAEPIYGIPESLLGGAWDALTPDLRQIAEDFQEFAMTRRTNL